jgi:hypothetical protein
LQQPFGHVVLSHWQAPMVVSQSLFGQLVHAFPPLPHCPLFSAVSWTQLPPLQQPLGHEVASQAHEPPVHS